MDGSHQELSHPKDILLLPDISNQMHVYEKNIYLTIFYSNPTSIFLNHVYVVKNKKNTTQLFFFSNIKPVLHVANLQSTVCGVDLERLGALAKFIKKG